MIENKIQNNCSGCRACEQVCPVQAITMTDDKEGFRVPIVNVSVCVNCGKCNNVCMYDNAPYKVHVFEQPRKAYVAWNRSLQLRKESTSGGLFSVIATCILKKDGVVYGCAWATDLTVHHIRITTLSGLSALKKSKYIESDTEHTFSEVKKDLHEGKIVLYSGTPCQIAGLKYFLGKEYDNLYTIDLVCEGVPSPLIFKKYLQWIEKKEKCKVVNFMFRDYSEKLQSACISYQLENSRKISVRLGQSFFFRLFYELKINRLSCYTCLYSKPERVGDFTLSDFWGIENTYPEMKKERKCGINLVLCNSDKALRLFDTVKENLWFKEVSVERALGSDIRLRGTISKPEVRNVIYSELANSGFDYIGRKYCRSPKDIFYRILPDCLINMIRIFINK